MRGEEIATSSENENVGLIRTAYEAYAQGDAAAFLDLVDPDLEWTFLDPSIEDPEPQVCRGRDELATRMTNQSQRGLQPQLEEITGYGDHVLAVTRTPGLDALRARKTNDRNYHVVTVRDGRISALRACRSRDEAVAFARKAEPAPPDNASSQ